MAVIEFRKEYRSYLLRMWRVREEEGEVWRCSLEDVMTGEKRGFTCLEELKRFFEAFATAEEKHPT